MFRRSLIPWFVVLVAPAALADPLSATTPVNTNAAVDSGADHHATLAMDALGHVVTVWTSTDALGGTVGNDADILFAASVDFGVTWSAAAPVDAGSTTDAFDDRAASLAMGGGVLVTTWQTRGRFGADSDIVFARSTNGGQSWSAPALLNSNGAIDVFDDTAPRIATDGAGRWIVVWVSNAPDPDVMYARSIDGGQTWTPPQHVDPAAAGDLDDDVDPVVAASETGQWIIAWASNDRRTAPGTADFDLLVVRSLDDGATWSAPALLNTNGALDAGDDRAPDVAADGTGRWVATWHEHGSLPWGPDGDVLVARSLNDGASWSAPREIYGFSVIELGDEREPHIATDRAGTWIVVWWREDSLPGGGAHDVDILQARSIDGGVSWIGPELINADALTDVGDDYSPMIATSRTGNWRVVWQTDDALSGTIGTDLDIVTAGAVCGDGLVQLNEQCDDGNLLAGDCCSPTCQLAPAGSVCRAVAGTCDVQEVCTGVDGMCPADQVVVGGVECRAATGACDPADACDGVNPACPVDVPAVAGTSCRPAIGPCDAPETCDGVQLTCPADAVAMAGSVCRPAAGDCDVDESCDGTQAGCPADVLVVAGVVCRGSAGVCDVDDVCTGANALCPADARVPAGVVCRPAAAVCDAAEACNGGADCPLDLAVADGVACSNGVVCDGTERCQAGACVAGAALACDDGDACTAESCTEPGGCGRSPVPGCCNVDADCGDGNACTTDVCSGPGGTCGHAVIAGCCLGAADCGDGDACTVDVCSGPGGTCGSTGITNCCQVDADCAPVACAAVSCDLGSARCVATPTPGCCASDVACDDGNACTADTCDLNSGTCGRAPIAGCCNTNADCDDGDACTADVCSGPGGTCGGTPIVGCCIDDQGCDDGNACTQDACNLTTNRCEAAPVAGCCAVDADCAAGPVCTTAHCNAGSCEVVATPSCCTVDSECDDDNACTVDRCSGGTCVRSDACGGDGGVVDGAVGEGGADGGVDGDGAVGDGADDAAVGDGAVDDGAVGDGAVDDGAVGDGAADAGADASADDASDGANVGDAGDGASVDDGSTDGSSDGAPTPGDGATLDSGGGADGGLPRPDGSASEIDTGRLPDDGFILDDDGCECSSTDVGATTAPWSILLFLGLGALLRRRS